MQYMCNVAKLPLPHRLQRAVKQRTEADSLMLCSLLMKAAVRCIKTVKSIKLISTEGICFFRKFGSTVDQGHESSLSSCIDIISEVTPCVG
jgi:hypothetical protein